MSGLQVIFRKSYNQMNSRFALSCVASTFLACSAAAQITIDNHPPTYSAEGILQPWTSFGDALEREMRYYLRAQSNMAILVLS